MNLADLGTILPDPTWWLAVAHRIGWTLVHSVWQLAAVAFLMIVVMQLLGRARPQWRYLCGCVGLLLMACLPVLTFALLPSPEIELGDEAELPWRSEVVATDLSTTRQVPPESHHNETDSAATAGGNEDSSHFASHEDLQVDSVPGTIDVTPHLRNQPAQVASTPIVSRRPQPERDVVSSPPTPSDPADQAATSPPVAYVDLLPELRRLVPWLPTVWLGGVLILAVVHMCGLWIARRLCREHVTECETRIKHRIQRVARRLRIGRTVRLLETACAQTPMVIGWLRPVILVPAGMIAGLPPAQLDAILAHELAHIRRHDYLVNLLQVLVETLLFYHPGVWWLSRRIRAEREYCCDDIAAAVCGSKLDFAKALAAVEAARTDASLALAAVGSGKEKMTMRRVRRLLDDRAPKAAAGGGALGVLLATFLMAGVAACFAMASDTKTTKAIHSEETIESGEDPPVQPDRAEKEANDVVATGVIAPRTPIDPHRFALYHASRGTFPTEQGFRLLDDDANNATPRVENGVLRQGPTTTQGLQRWVANRIPLDFRADRAAGLNAEWIIRVVNSQSAEKMRRTGWKAEFVDRYHRFQICLANDQIALWADPDPEPAVVGFDTTDAFHHYQFVLDDGQGTLLVDGEPLLTKHMTNRKPIYKGNHVEFGDGTGKAGGQVELKTFYYSNDPRAKSPFHPPPRADLTIAGCEDFDWRIRKTNASGWEYTNEKGALTVKQIDAIRASPGIQPSAPWATIELSHKLPKVHDFTLEADLSWQASDLRAMHYLIFRLTGQEGLVASAMHYDAWYGHRGSRAWSLDDSSGQSGQDTQPLTGRGTLTLTRSDGKTRILWGDKVIHEGTSGRPVDQVTLTFGLFPYDGARKSTLGTLTVHRLTLRTPEIERKASRRSKLYSAGHGTPPSKQGFTRKVANASGVDPKVRRDALMIENVGKRGQLFWETATQPLRFTAGDGIAIEWIAQIESTETYFKEGVPFRSGYGVQIIDQDLHEMVVFLGEDYVAIRNYQKDPQPAIYGFDTTDGFHHYRFVVDDGVGKLFIDGGAEPVAVRKVGKANPTLKTRENRVSFGDLTLVAGGTTRLKKFGYSTDARAKSALHTGDRMAEKLRESLILHYPLDEKRSDGNVWDESDHGNNAKAHIASPPTDGVIGRAYQFNGKDEYITRDFDPKSGLHPTDTPFTVSRLVSHVDDGAKRTDDRFDPSRRTRSRRLQAGSALTAS